MSDLPANEAEHRNDRSIPPPGLRILKATLDASIDEANAAARELMLQQTRLQSHL